MPTSFEMEAQSRGLTVEEFRELLEEERNRENEETLQRQVEQYNLDETIVDPSERDFIKAAALAVQESTVLAEEEPRLTTGEGIELLPPQMEWQHEYYEDSEAAERLLAEQKEALSYAKIRKHTNPEELKNVENNIRILESIQRTGNYGGEFKGVVSPEVDDSSVDLPLGPVDVKMTGPLGKRLAMFIQSVRPSTEPITEEDWDIARIKESFAMDTDGNDIMKSLPNGFTVTDWKNTDPEFLKKWPMVKAIQDVEEAFTLNLGEGYGRWLELGKSRAGTFMGEYMREEDIDAWTAFVRSEEIEGWGDKMKAQYIFLRQIWDKTRMASSPKEILEWVNASPAERKNMTKPRFAAAKEWGEWFHDSAYNFATSPFELFTAAASVRGGGAVTVGLRGYRSYAIRTAKKTAWQKALNNPRNKARVIDPADRYKVQVSQAAINKEIKKQIERSIIAQNMAKSQGLKRLALMGAESKLLRSISIFGTQGMLSTAAYDYTRQLMNIRLGLQEEAINYKQTAVSGAYGFGFGAAFPVGGKTLGVVLPRLHRKYTQLMGRKRFLEKTDETYSMDDARSDLAKMSKEDSKFSPTKQMLNRAASLWPGKSVSAFKEWAKASPTLKAIIESIRSDVMQGTADLKILQEKLTRNYGGSVGARAGEWLYRWEEILGNLRVGRTEGFWGRFHKGVVKEEERQVLWLLSSDAPKLFQNAYKKGSSFLKDGFQRLTIKDGPTAIRKQLEEIDLLTRHINNTVDPAQKVTKEVVEAALELRKLFDDMFEAGKIENPQWTDTPIDLFQGSSKISNYVPRHWILTAVEEKGQILRDLLIKSGNADLINDAKTVRAIRAEGSEVERVILFDQQEAIDKRAFRKALEGANDFRHLAQQQADMRKGTRGGYAGDDIADIPFDQLNKKQQASILKRAKELKAEAIIQQMLDRADYPYHIDKPSPSGAQSSFLKHRPFHNIPDEVLREHGFISTNLADIMPNYISKMASSIERARLYGRTIDDFNRTLGEQVRQELAEYGEKNLSGKAKKRFENRAKKMMKSLTEIVDATAGYNTIPRHGSRFLKDNKWGRGISDSIKLINSFAHLGMATVSSITEPLILLSRTNLEDYPKIVDDVFVSSANQMKRMFWNTAQNTKIAFGGETRGKLAGRPDVNSIKRWFKNLNDEDYRDLMESGASLESSMFNRIEAMYGEGISSNLARSLAGTYFNLNLLSPWTQMVQETAFKTGRRKAFRIIGELADGTDYWGNKLGKTGRLRRISQLHEFGIDAFRAVDSYNDSFRSSSDVLAEITGETPRAAGQAVATTDIPPEARRGIWQFDETLWKGTEFYRNEFIPAAVDFSKAIILNPSVVEANKPLWFSNPVAQLLMQFAGYPTAFGNIVLKDFIKSLSAVLPRQGIKSRGIGDAGKTLASVMLMTGVASYMNTLRSRGENLKNTPQEQLWEAARRWGAFGFGEHAYKLYQAEQHGGLSLGPVAKAPFGPLVSSFIDGIRYSQDPYSIAVQKYPFFSALSPRTRRQAIEKRADRWEDHMAILGRKIEDIQRSQGRSSWSRGGVVDIPNAPREPDERKMRGWPTTYQEAAGPIAEDTEDRAQFALGQKVDVGVRNAPADPAAREIRDEVEGSATYEETARAVDRNPVYAYLTQDENEDPLFTPSQEPVRLVTTEEMPPNTAGSEYIIGLDTNTAGAKQEAVDRSTEIGLQASRNLENISGAVKFMGNVGNIHNPLQLNKSLKEIEDLPEFIALYLNDVNNYSQDIPVDPELHIQAINDMNYALDERRFALREDTDAYLDDGEEVIQRSKSFVIRQTLLNLGYDSIQFNNNEFVLLNPNQFMAQKIIEQPKPEKLKSTKESEQDRIGFAIGGKSLAQRIARRAIPTQRIIHTPNQSIYPKGLYVSKEGDLSEGAGGGGIIDVSEDQLKTQADIKKRQEQVEINQRLQPRYESKTEIAIANAPDNLTGEALFNYITSPKRNLPKKEIELFDWERFRSDLLKRIDELDDSRLDLQGVKTTTSREPVRGELPITKETMLQHIKQRLPDDFLLSANQREALSGNVEMDKVVDIINEYRTPTYQFGTSDFSNLALGEYSPITPQHIEKFKKAIPFINKYQVGGLQPDAPVKNMVDTTNLDSSTIFQVVDTQKVYNMVNDPVIQEKLKRIIGDEWYWDSPFDPVFGYRKETYGPEDPFRLSNKAQQKTIQDISLPRGGNELLTLENAPHLTREEIDNLGSLRSTALMSRVRVRRFKGEKSGYSGRIITSDLAKAPETYFTGTRDEIVPHQIEEYNLIRFDPNLTFLVKVPTADGFPISDSTAYAARKTVASSENYIILDLNYYGTYRQHLGIETSARLPVNEPYFHNKFIIEGANENAMSRRAYGTDINAESYLEIDPKNGFVVNPETKELFPIENLSLINKPKPQALLTKEDFRYLGELNTVEPRIRNVNREDLYALTHFTYKDFDTTNSIKYRDSITIPNELEAKIKLEEYRESMLNQTMAGAIRAKGTRPHIDKWKNATIANGWDHEFERLLLNPNATGIYDPQGYLIEEIFKDYSGHPFRHGEFGSHTHATDKRMVVSMFSNTRPLVRIVADIDGDNYISKNEIIPEHEARIRSNEEKQPADSIRDQLLSARGDLLDNRYTRIRTAHEKHPDRIIPPILVDHWSYMATRQQFLDAIRKGLPWMGTVNADTMMQKYGVTLDITNQVVIVDAWDNNFKNLIDNLVEHTLEYTDFNASAMLKLLMSYSETDPTFSLQGFKYSDNLKILKSKYGSIENEEITVHDLIAEAWNDKNPNRNFYELTPPEQKKLLESNADWKEIQANFKDMFRRDMAYILDLNENNRYMLFDVSHRYGKNKDGPPRAVNVYDPEYKQGSPVVHAEPPDWKEDYGPIGFLLMSRLKSGKVDTDLALPRKFWTAEEVEELISGRLDRAPTRISSDLNISNSTAEYNTNIANAKDIYALDKYDQSGATSDINMPFFEMTRSLRNIVESEAHGITTKKTGSVITDEEMSDKFIHQINTREEELREMGLSESQINEELKEMVSELAPLHFETVDPKTYRLRKQEYYNPDKDAERTAINHYHVYEIRDTDDKQRIVDQVNKQLKALGYGDTQLKLQVVEVDFVSEPPKGALRSPNLAALEGFADLNMRHNQYQVAVRIPEFVHGPKGTVKLKDLIAGGDFKWEPFSKGGLVDVLKIRRRQRNLRI